MRVPVAIALGVALAATVALAQEPATEGPPPDERPRSREAAYYTVEHFTPPEGEVLEVGGLDFTSDGRLLVSTRRGQVWLVDGALGEDVADARFTLFAEGLNEGLGLTVVDDEIYVLQRGELSRLVDEDGDDRCDRIDTISDAWGLSGNYHEFAFGLPRDDDGHFYVTLNVGFWSPKWWHGKAKVPYRGWALRVAPDGTTTPVACGFRSPAGVGRNAAGEIFVTDNQGDWMASSPIFHLKEGAFYGHPASLDWTEEYRASKTLASDEIPPARASERTPAALWIPYDWSRSTGNLVEDSTGGAFGPFGGQMFVAELTNGMVLRALLEKVRGEYQGACLPFRQQVGSVCRVRFGPDGSLFAGLTNRGWGGLSPAHGLARLRWTGEVPLEVHGVHLLQDGFEVTLTRPLAPECQPAPGDIDMVQYDYNYWWEYGSPEQQRQPLDVTSVELSDDRRTLRFHTAVLTPAMVVRCRLNGLFSADGARLLHEEFAYTINQLPEGPLATSLVAKIVEPPPSRETEQHGWLRLTWGDALDGWKSEGWELCDVQLDPEDPRRFLVSPGVNALVNTATGLEGPSHFVSKAEFGDCELSTSFMLPEGGNSGVYLMGRYEVQLLDSERVRQPGFGDCGGIYRGSEWPGSPPSLNLFKQPGVWHDLEIEFRAPRFDARGEKTENARFVSVKIDGAEVQSDVEVPEPTLGAIARDEVPRGPILLQGDHGPVALGAISVRPRIEPEPEGESDGWTVLFDGEDLDAWQPVGEADWEIDGDSLIGSGGPGFLVTAASDFTEFDLRARAKINDGGNSGLLLRAAVTGEGVAGYEAEIDSSFPDADKTASLVDLAPVHTQLLPADTWFDYELSCREEPDGVRLTVRVNGVVFNEVLDTERRHTGGHIVIEQHHTGSVVELQGIRVRRW